MAILLILVPADKTGLICGKLDDGPSRGVLSWNQLHRGVGWDVVLLIGGGFAMADGQGQF